MMMVVVVDGGNDVPYDGDGEDGGGEGFDIDHNNC